MAEDETPDLREFLNDPPMLVRRAVSLRLGLPTDHPKVKHIAIALRESIDALAHVVDDGWGNVNIYVENHRYLNTSRSMTTKPRNWDNEE